MVSYKTNRGHIGKGKNRLFVKPVLCIMSLFEEKQHE